MQTFLPYPDFAASAAVLDRQRLGKQRVEALQLVRTLTFGGGWARHPAARMWRGYTGALVRYGVAVCDEWIRRGYADTCRGKILGVATGPGDGMPPWLGDARFHSAHRAALLAKDFGWYGRFGWAERPEVRYVWPN